MRRTVPVLLALLAVLTLSGCRERMCEEGQYPARSTQFPETGRVCVPVGQEPPVGYERFPAGQEPTFVDQDH
ncbi:MAG: lipoprotein [Kineosporiaceae bacterium]